MIAGRAHRTPLMSSRSLSEAVGTRVSLKAELFQRTGSFKIRGATNRVAALTADERVGGVITVSTGNHAQGLALACSEAGVSSLILMPHAASPLKVAATRSYGAQVDLDSADAAEAFERMRSIAAETGRVVLHPYDDQLVIAGQGTVGLEILNDAPDVDVVVVPVGGGGLISGIALTVKSTRPAARIVGVQPEAVGSLRRSLDEGRPMPSFAEPTAADALAAPVIGTRCLEVCAHHVDGAVDLTEDELRDGLRFVYQRAKLAAEVGGGAAVAALLAGKIPVAPGEHVVAVVTGGNISDVALGDAFAAGR